jgi:dethiobiotin synthetase
MKEDVFVAGSGTELGKTHVAAALIRLRRVRGLVTRPVKPLMSGFDPARLADSDAGRLLAACGLEATPAAIDAVCLHRFPEAVSPHLAARAAGVTLDFDAILRFCSDRLSGPATALVEGAGGVLSPLTDATSQADLMVALRLPVLLVSANYLGAISHTLTALEALTARGLEVRALAVSQPSPQHAAPAALADEIAGRSGVECFAFPHGAPDGTLAPLCDRLWPAGGRN